MKNIFHNICNNTKTEKNGRILVIIFYNTLLLNNLYF